MLARDDIALEIIETAGSVENADLLSGESGADIALVQGGVPLEESASGLAAVSVEPLWIFARSDMYVAADPNDWRGLKVAAGGAGSGSRLVADRLAAYTGAEALERQAASDAGGETAAEALLARDIDIALFVAPADAAYLQTLFKSEGSESADARCTAMPSHSACRGRGRCTCRPVFSDYRRPFPPESVELVALVARLVAREGLHPALINRLIHAVIEVHGGGSVIPADQQYPSAEDLGVTANGYAAQLLTDGFSPLEGLLPYWIVAQVNRILLVLVPALLLLLPLLRLLPAVFQWVFRTRVYSSLCPNQRNRPAFGGPKTVALTPTKRAPSTRNSTRSKPSCARPTCRTVPESRPIPCCTTSTTCAAGYQPDNPAAETAANPTAEAAGDTS
ncbi:MAG: hypothetical protein U5K56_11825 [Halioglobus sp.]|nr:hypothetical protein [Halioglobus sp.]